jgi:hypothetical protein
MCPAVCIFHALLVIFTRSYSKRKTLGVLPCAAERKIILLQTGFRLSFRQQKMYPDFRVDAVYCRLAPCSSRTPRFLM